MQKKQIKKIVRLFQKYHNKYFRHLMQQCISTHTEYTKRNVYNTVRTKMDKTAWHIITTGTLIPGRDDPSLAFIGFARLTRIVLPNNSDSF